MLNSSNPRATLQSSTRPFTTWFSKRYFQDFHLHVLHRIGIEINVGQFMSDIILGFTALCVSDPRKNLSFPEAHTAHTVPPSSSPFTVLWTTSPGLCPSLFQTRIWVWIKTVKKVIKCSLIHINPWWNSHRLQYPNKICVFLTPDYCIYLGTGAPCRLLSKSSANCQLYLPL